jgi:hypothetical protein
VSFSTGGTHRPAPKDDLAGSIEDSDYLAKDGSFTVRVPHAEDSSEYPFMQVKEMAQAGPGGTERYVSFGPAAVCQGIWRLSVSPVPDPSRTPANFDQLLDLLAGRMAGELTAAYTGPLQLVSEGREPVAGRPARQRVYSQACARGGYLTDATATLKHEVFLIDLGRAVAFVWVQSDGSSGSKGALPARAFAESVRLH